MKKQQYKNDIIKKDNICYEYYKNKIGQKLELKKKICSQQNCVHVSKGQTVLQRSSAHKNIQYICSCKRCSYTKHITIVLNYRKSQY